MVAGQNQISGPEETVIHYNYYHQSEFIQLEKKYALKVTMSRFFWPLCK